MKARLQAILAALFISASTTLSAADCIDVSRGDEIRLSGQLAHRTFSRNMTGNGASQPETSAYVLQLETPSCFSGDKHLGGEVTVSEVHLIVSADDERGLFSRLHDLIGKDVTVRGDNAFGSYSEDHHAPVVFVITDVAEAPDNDHLTAKKAVTAFYRALELGDGQEAARHIIPRKRGSGPLSAPELSGFYGNLSRPLELLDVSDLGAGRYRASYRFETNPGARCDGSAIITTTALNGQFLISRIIAEKGC